MRNRLPARRAAATAALAVLAASGLLTPAASASAPSGAPPAPAYAFVDLQQFLADGGNLNGLPAAAPLQSHPATPSATPADVPDPDLRTQCSQHTDAAGSTNGWAKNRFEKCFFKHQDLVLVRSDTLEKIGTLSFDEWILGFTYDGSRRVDYVPSIENIYVSTVPPADARTWAINMDFSATVVNGGGADITRPAQQSRDDLLGSWNQTPQWTLTYTSDDSVVANPGKFLNANTAVSLGATAPGAAPWTDPVNRNTNVRFDSAGTGGAKAQGTIFSDVRSTLMISLSDTASGTTQSARHFDDALHHPERTFPSFTGKNVPGENRPLHRLINPDQQNANNTAAIKTCVDVWGVYDGNLLNCDEFPFASTYEGAAAGDNNYSARLIDASDNQTAGRKLLSLYNSDRLFDNDEFYVQVTP